MWELCVTQGHTTHIFPRDFNRFLQHSNTFAQHFSFVQHFRFFAQHLHSFPQHFDLFLQHLITFAQHFTFSTLLHACPLSSCHTLNYFALCYKGKNSSIGDKSLLAVIKSISNMQAVTKDEANCMQIVSDTGTDTISPSKKKQPGITPAASANELCMTQGHKQFLQTNCARIVSDTGTHTTHTQLTHSNSPTSNP